MRPKDIGTRAETAVVDYLRRCGFPNVERRALAGVNDRGDIAGLPGVVIEVKDHGRMELATWLNEAQAEARGLDVGVVWHKRRGKGSPADWIVSMGGTEFVMFLKEYTR